MTIAPPCSAALPTTATTTTAMKKSLRPTAFANAPSEWTRISHTHAVAAVATARVTSAVVSDQVPSPGSSRFRSGGAGGYGPRPEIEEQEHDRHRHRGDHDGMPFGCPRVAERGRERERDDCDSDEPELHEQRAAIDPRAVRADDLGDAVHEEQVRDHAPRE